MSETHRRRKTLHVSLPIFLGMLRPGRKPDYEVVQGIPPDARIVAVKVGSAFDRYADDTLCLLVESAEFEEVGEGLCIPEMDVTFRSIE